MANPIVKVRNGVRTFGAGGVRYHKSWAFICPLCPDATPDVRHAKYYGRNRDSRKAAKDALHEHMVTQHPAPR